MPFKDDYLSGERVTLETWRNGDSAIKRIRGLYNAAGIVVRRGVRLTDEAAGELWKTFFQPFREYFPQFSSTRAKYDAALLQQIATLADLLRKMDLLQRGQLGDFGIAQKMSNLFIKDHWALGVFPAEIELVLHIPLDQRLLFKLKRPPATWRSWTKASDTPETRSDYLKVQDRFRSDWARVLIFQSPIEMEQFIWYRIRNA